LPRFIVSEHGWSDQKSSRQARLHQKTKAIHFNYQMDGLGQTSTNCVQFVVAAPPQWRSQNIGMGKIPWVSPKDMHAGAIVDSELKITETALQESSLELVPVGSVLIVGRSGILKRKLPAQITSVPCTVNQDLKALTPIAPLSSTYLRLMLLGTEGDILKNDVKTGTTVQSLVFDKLFARKFGLPPQAEQDRIIAKVDELMALCDRLETRQSDAQAAHARLVDELLGSLLQARDAKDFAECWGRVKGSFDVLFTTEQSIDDLKRMFLSLAVTGKLSSSKELGNIGWYTGPFNDLIDPLFPIAYGVLVPGPETAGGIPFVRIADLSISSASAQPEKTISPDVDAKFSRTRLRGGEILMGVVGSIGKLGVAPDSWAGANIARAICRIVPNAKVCKAYMLWLLQSDVMQKQFIGDTRTLAQPTLNVGMIRSAVASIPPLAEQYRIVAKIDEFMALCDRVKVKLARVQALNGRLAGTLVERAVL